MENYDYIEKERYKNIENSDVINLFNKLKCQKCCNLPLYPLTLPFKNYYYCKNCIPGTLNPKFFTYAEKVSLSILIIKCKFYKNGCREEKAYLQAKSYFENHEEQCLFIQYECYYCKLKIFCRDIRSHKNCVRFSDIQDHLQNNNLSIINRNLNIDIFNQYSETFEFKNI